jgi:protein phosphatase
MKFDIFKPIVLNELGKRENQEDSVCPSADQVTEQSRLFLVCDGMGGHSKGEVASSVVCETISKWLASHVQENGVVDDDTIRDAIDQSHRELNKRDDGAVQKMGTTLTLLCMHNGGVTMGHIGDSRVYHIRPSKRQILYKSIDHSLVYDMFRSGEITYDEMASSKKRNVITRAMMPGDDNEVDIDLTHTTDVLPGDYFYLCSDGMLEQMSDKQLLDLLCDPGTDEKKASLLKSSTLDNRDNHSAILVRVKGVSSEVGDENLPNDEATSHYNEIALLAAMEPEEESEQIVMEAPMEPETMVNVVQDDLNGLEPKSGGGFLRYVLLGLLLALVACAAYYFFTMKGGDDKKAQPASVEQNVSAPQQQSDESSSGDEPTRRHAAPSTTKDAPAKQQNPNAASAKQNDKKDTKNPQNQSTSAKKLDKAIDSKNNYKGDDARKWLERQQQQQQQQGKPGTGQDDKNKNKNKNRKDTLDA